MNSIDWQAIENNCQNVLPKFNKYKWQICKNQLISMGMPLASVAIVMSVPDNVKTTMDVQRIAMAHYPIIR